MIPVKDLSFIKAIFVGALNPLSANPTKWPNTLKQFVGKLPTNCLSVFGRFVKLAFKGLSCLRRLSNHGTYVTIICVTKFKSEFQKYQAQKREKFLTRNLSDGI